MFKLFKTQPNQKKLPIHYNLLSLLFKVIDISYWGYVNNINILLRRLRLYDIYACIFVINGDRQNMIHTAINNSRHKILYNKKNNKYLLLFFLS